VGSTLCRVASASDSSRVSCANSVSNRSDT